MDAEQVAEKLQRNLYIAVDEINVKKLMGKWFTVIVDFHCNFQKSNMDLTFIKKNPTYSRFNCECAYFLKTTLKPNKH